MYPSPVQIRIIRDDPRVKLANQVNLASALRVALLTLPERFEERDLYERIAGLSYGGQYPFRTPLAPRRIDGASLTAAVSPFPRARP